MVVAYSTLDGRRRRGSCSLLFPAWTLALSSFVGFLLGAGTARALPRPRPAPREPAGDDGEPQWSHGPAAAVATQLPTATATTTTLPSSPGQAERKGPIKVAVCVSGHIRSWVAPGLVQRWDKYLLRRDSEVVTDVYMMVKLGNDNHGDQKFYPQSLTDPRLKCPLAVVRPYLKHFEVKPKGNDCAHLLRIWEDLGMCRSMPCGCTCPGPGFYQIAGVHAALHTALASGVDYDFYVRLRPDCELRSPIQYRMMNSSKMTIMLRGVGSGHDQMFVVGRGGVFTSFQMIFETYYRSPPCPIGGPDNQAFTNKGMQRLSQVIHEKGGAWEMPIIHRGRELRCARRANISALGVNDTSSETYCRNLLRACGRESIGQG